MFDDEEIIETPQESSDESNQSELSLGDTIKEAFARSRDEQGKFKEESEKEPEVTGEIESQEIPVEKVKSSRPPESWTPASKAKFAELPQEIQQEITRREEDVHKGFTKFDEQRVFGKQVEDLISPYLPMIRSEGGNAIETIGGILQTGYTLRTGTNESKVRAIEFLVNKYNIDLGSMGSQGQQQNHYVDPTVQQLQNQVWELTQAQQNQYEMVEQQEQTQIHSVINSFASDPKNIYFEDVKPRMATLLKDGHCESIEEAYTEACNGHPIIGPLIVQANNKQLVHQNREKVNKSRNAAVSVTGSPVGSSRSVKPQDRTLSEEIAENLRAAQGRA